MMDNIEKVIMLDYAFTNTMKSTDKSIDKWKGIIKGTNGDKGTGNCPLCDQFFMRSLCRDCPVHAVTGKGGCIGSPYENWMKTVTPTGFADLECDFPFFANTKEKIKAANHELSFLYEVRLFWINRHNAVKTSARALFSNK